jgi:hypothetical protein
MSRAPGVTIAPLANIGLMTRAVTALAALLLATGCATIFEHRSKHFSLQSIPDGAEFELTKVGDSRPLQVGVTPASVTLRRGNGYFVPARYTVHVHKDGYEPETVAFGTSVTGNYWFNLLWLPILTLWPPIAMLIVDPLTGAMYDIDVPTAVVLRKQVSAALPPNE